ncbi:MAG: rhodanese-like domain-containing protein [Erysipelotrichaceae bacterium]|nr:rhodanese-like domain-containing protein [Erysipelotrichaceae bacterium]
MKKILTVLLGLSLFGCSSKANYHQIDGQSALDMMNNETDYIIIDVRTESEYQQGHIKNAINIPNESIDESVSEILTDKDQLLLVYCRSGNRSKQASEKLAKLGYSNIYEFGGISDFPGEIVNQ